MRSKRAGTDRKYAEREAAKLEDQLSQGTYRELKAVNWSTFVEEVVGFRSGSHADEARRALDEFSGVCKPTSPRVVRQGAIRTYVQTLREKGNAVDTVKKKLRYLRLAFNDAVSLDYLGKNPMDGWTWEKSPRREKRILGAEEETRLLVSCEKLYGLQMQAFVGFCLETWGRFGEVTRLLWDDVNFEDGSVYFRNTKSHEDRYVPIELTSDLWGMLRRLQAQTLQDGGPFIALDNKANLAKKWDLILEDADIPPITRHDLRRTGISRALVGGMPGAVVQKLAGHKKIETTMTYYAEVSKKDLRDAVAKLKKAQATG